MYGDTVLTNVARNLKTGLNLSMQANIASTLSASVYGMSVNIPDKAQVLRIYAAQALRVGFGETPVTLSTAAFVIGAVLNASEWGIFGLDNGVSRTATITCSTQVNVTLEVE
jgi:hypothetical protein